MEHEAEVVLTQLTLKCKPSIRGSVNPAPPSRALLVAHRDAPGEESLDIATRFHGLAAEDPRCVCCRTPISRARPAACPLEARNIRVFAFCTGVADAR
jgi:hypothetical protein